jgi:hypothetical protein
VNLGSVAGALCRTYWEHYFFIRTSLLS